MKLESRGSRVAAVVITFNRRERVGRWLDCIRNQTVQPSETFVVVNGSTDGTAEFIRRRYPEVTVLEQSENLGASGGAAVGMQAAYDAGHDWLWMFDDDAYPEPRALEAALSTAASLGDRKVGMVWLPFDDFGGWKWRGRKVPVSLAAEAKGAGQPFRVEQVDLNMTLVSRDVVKEVGVPRPDFFIMLWSCEYCLRVDDAGYEVWVVPEPMVVHEHAGSSGCGLWRTYYQSRNHLAIALSRKSIPIFFWWSMRHVRFFAGILLKADRKWTRLKLRLKGIRDALVGISGRVVEPGSTV